jgi:hypothetical protein
VSPDTRPTALKIRRNFPDLREAIGFKAEMEIAALNAAQAETLKRTRLSDEQLAQAEAAIRKLEGTDHTLIQGVDSFSGTGSRVLPSKIS